MILCTLETSPPTIHSYVVGLDFFPIVHPITFVLQPLGSQHSRGTNTTTPSSVICHTCPHVRPQSQRMILIHTASGSFSQHIFAPFCCFFRHSLSSPPLSNLFFDIFQPSAIMGDPSATDYVSFTKVPIITCKKLIKTTIYNIWPDPSN